MQPQPPNQPPQYPPYPYSAPPPPNRQSRVHRAVSWYGRQGCIMKVLVGIVALFLVLFVCSAAISGLAQGIAGSTTSSNSNVTASDTTVASLDATTVAISTSIAPTDQPTAAPTPVPTKVPIVPPTAVPTPPAPPAVVYNFNPAGGHLVYNPPADLCYNYGFTCIANFDNGRGYVEECQDGDLSKSGGISGSCSHHGGDKQPLYSH